MKISVFTVVMPEYTPEEAAVKLAKWGFDGVEWRVTAPSPADAPINFWGGNRCTVDPKSIVDQASKLKTLCRKNKLAMPNLAAYLHYTELKLIEATMEGAAIMGAPSIRVGVDGYDGSISYDKLLKKTVKGWEKVVKLGKKYKVKPVAEIHMGNIIPSCSAARRFADHFSPSEMGLIHDAGNMVYEGFENWQMGFEILGKYLAHVHVKNASWTIQEADATGNIHWAASFDTLRRGRVDWFDVLKALKAVGYDGWLSLEDFCPTPTDKKLTDDIKYLKRLLKKI